MAKILVADDESRFRKLVVGFLKKDGHEIVEASDGNEALNVLAAEPNIDLAVLDIMMPYINGLELCKIIKEQIDTCPDNRPELKEEYEHRLDIINQYAPQLMTDPANIHYIILKILTGAGIDYHTVNKGVIMKTIMPSLKGKADMSIVNKVVAELVNNVDNSMR